MTFDPKHVELNSPSLHDGEKGNDGVIILSTGNFFKIASFIV